MLGDARVPYKRETERFLQALAGLGEIVAFLVLGATVDLDVLGRQDVWVPGLVLAVCLAVLIRPVLVGLCMLPLRLDRRDQGFVLWAGLKGAVPILLGSMLLGADVPDAPRLYGVVVVVVMVSVVLQGSTVGLVASLLRIPMRTVDLLPYALGVRLRIPPDGAHRVTVAGGSIADGARLSELPQEGVRQWVSLVVRDGGLVQIRRRTRLAAGDEVLVLVGRKQAEESLALFTEPAPWRDES
jgi:cell volume regulation protein A